MMVFKSTSCLFHKQEIFECGQIIFPDFHLVDWFWGFGGGFFFIVFTFVSNKITTKGNRFRQGCLYFLTNTIQQLAIAPKHTSEGKLLQSLIMKRKDGNTTMQMKCSLVFSLQLLVHVQPEDRPQCGKPWSLFEKQTNKQKSWLPIFLSKGSMFQNQRCLPI